MSARQTAIVAARRRALIDATIATIHAEGSLDVTMAGIAARAGVSPALAHHYFGAKDRLILATMRHLLRGLQAAARAEWDRAPDPRARVSALVRASFGPEQFAPATISAWMVFYGLAQKDAGAARLLNAYVRRLRTHLTVALAPLAGERAGEIAECAGALIDGVYLRQALRRAPPDPAAAMAMVEAVIDARLAVPRG